VKVTITNWEKYNARSDRANYSWFRFQNGFFTDHKLGHLTIEDRVVFVFLLCEASKENAGEVEVSESLTGKLLNMPEAKITKAIQRLHAAGVMVAESHQLVESLPATYVRNERNETNERTLPAPAGVFDFESLYKKYPRKEGKTPGITKCKAQIKTQSDFEALSKAIDRYREYTVKTGVEPKYIKHFDTFMTSWRDWTDPETGSAAEPAPFSIAAILAKGEEGEHDRS
jgi:biotin operon repressor